MNFFRTLFRRRRVIFWMHEPLTPAQIHALIGRTGIGDNKLRCVLQLLQEHIENAQNVMTAPALASDPGKLAYQAGAAESLKVFQDHLFSIMDGQIEAATAPEPKKSRAEQLKTASK